MAWAGVFQWDEGNTGKLAKHHFTIDDVEAFFEADIFYAGRVTGEDSERWNEKRFMLIVRPEPSGPCLSLFVTDRADALRIVSCRRSRPDEERRHDKRIAPESENKSDGR
jgi:uncharacterized DUF497 family protein